MQYKGLLFPKDLWLIAWTVGKIAYYFWIIKKKSPQDLIEFIKCKSAKTNQGEIAKDLQQLEKIHRIITYILVRRLKYARPCLIRSCILFEHALKFGLDAGILIGVKPEQGTLEGHSWITIDHEPYRENIDKINEYTVMMRG